MFALTVWMNMFTKINNNIETIWNHHRQEQQLLHLRFTLSDFIHSKTFS